MCPEGKMDYLASGLLLSLSVYKPTSLSTDLVLLPFSVPFCLFQLEFLLLTWDLKRILSCGNSKPTYLWSWPRVCWPGLAADSAVSRPRLQAQVTRLEVLRVFLSRGEKILYVKVGTFVFRIKQLAEENAPFEFEFDLFWFLSVYSLSPKLNRQISLWSVQNISSTIVSKTVFLVHIIHMWMGKKKNFSTSRS